MADEPVTPSADAPELYRVCRAQDGETDRTNLTLDQAKDECAMLNAQARVPVGQTVDGITIYGSMVHGEISRYEVRSMSGLVVA